MAKTEFQIVAKHKFLVSLKTSDYGKYIVAPVNLPPAMAYLRKITPSRTDQKEQFCHF